MLLSTVICQTTHQRINDGDLAIWPSIHVDALSKLACNLVLHGKPVEQGRLACNFLEPDDRQEPVEGKLACRPRQQHKVLELVQRHTVLVQRHKVPEPVRVQQRKEPELELVQQHMGLEQARVHSKVLEQAPVLGPVGGNKVPVQGPELGSKVLARALEQDNKELEQARG